MPYFAAPSSCTIMFLPFACKQAHVQHVIKLLSPAKSEHAGAKGPGKLLSARDHRAEPDQQTPENDGVCMESARIVGKCVLPTLLQSATSHGSMLPRSGVTPTEL